MQKKETHITVLLPAYNAEKYIGEAIESILTQSYRHFEFLIIDDGSTDGTLNIIRSYSDTRIRLIIHERNMGLKNTLNEGIARASYNLIARMDADDISHPWRLEKQVAYMLAHPDCTMVDSWVKVMDREKRFIKTEGIHARYVYYTLTFECCIYHPTVLFRKNCVESIGGYLLDYAEDYDLFWRLSRIYRIHTLEEPLLWYRIHEQNLNTVIKKSEYNEFTHRVWKNNLDYFLGKHTVVPDEYAACYRYDFDPLLQKQSLAEIRNCITLLDTLSACILQTENPNRNTDAILFISDYKKKYILKGLASGLSLIQMIKLLTPYKYYSLLGTLILQRIKNYLTK